MSTLTSLNFDKLLSHTRTGFRSLKEHYRIIYVPPREASTEGNNIPYLHQRWELICLHLKDYKKRNLIAVSNIHDINASRNPLVVTNLI